MHVLLLEDDVHLGQGLMSSLRQTGHSVVWHRTVEDKAPHPAADTFDVVLLDLGLGRVDGMDLLRAWRRAGVLVPVLVMTARTALPDRLAGLDEGADDYLPKPFATAELISRMHALHRRHLRHASDRWRIGDLEISPKDQRAWMEGTPLDLSAREFQLLASLARNPGGVVAKSTLGQRLAPLGPPLDASVIEVHVSNLRRKIGAHRIRTLRGIGYQLIP